MHHIADLEAERQQLVNRREDLQRKAMMCCAP
jgi:hypothetical protein